jgi:hypothetical protein
MDLGKNKTSSLFTVSATALSWFVLDIFMVGAIVYVLIALANRESLGKMPKSNSL